MNWMQGRRQELKISQATLGVVARVRTQTVHLIEVGKVQPSRPQRARLAAALGLNPALLLEEVEFRTDDTAALAKLGKAYLHLKRVEAEAAQ